ncbi:Water Stress and Hypersensitive response [Methanoregula boonei 6A8]|jgi:LEA14-like dessication related protein|uniref:Water Stress and Hypersensitive response n=1 Tax=Methanoregula boonei (strain DSM 21154 / JCM 14090 / 6A8) TaxID=456442 RepID=A7I4B3_METB6|nr:LEA type 2 family protein [Methanoregula boonei]ABS54574.1 Water Stress and Hypersensitive response [Methanoregula boonei 6A8]
MPVLSDPVVTLEGVSLRNVSLSSIGLEVAIRVENPNPLGADLQECLFTVIYPNGGADNRIATGNTGGAKIPARGSAVLRVPVSSDNAALIGALAAFVTHGGIELTIKGTAVLKFLMITKPVPFSRTMSVSIGEIADIVTGQNKKE